MLAGRLRRNIEYKNGNECNSICLTDHYNMIEQYFYLELIMETKHINTRLKEYKKITELFDTSFSDNEKIPIWLLRLFSYRSCVDFIAFYDNGIFVGFTYLITVKETTFVLYIATSPDQRSKGYGSKILHQISELHNGNTIVLNIENVDEIYDNYSQRIQRQKFYFKNKFMDSGYILKDNKVIYDILYKGNCFSEINYKEIFKVFSFGLVRVKICKK